MKKIHIVLFVGIFALLGVASCKKNMESAGSAINTWKFTDSVTNVSYSGIFKGGVAESFHDSLLNIWGTTYSATDTAFGIAVFFDKGFIMPGSYTLYNSNVNSITLEANNDEIYGASFQSQLLPSPAWPSLSSSNITIDSYDTYTKNLIGSFHCISYGPGNNLTVIKGSFNCILP